MLQLFIAFLAVGVFITLKNGFVIQIFSESILPILILGVINTEIGCYLCFSSIGKLSLQTVAICGYLEPASAVVFSVMFLKEKISLLQILGAVLIVGSAIFAENKKSLKSGNKSEVNC